MRRVYASTAVRCGIASPLQSSVRANTRSDGSFEASTESNDKDGNVGGSAEVSSDPGRGESPSSQREPFPGPPIRFDHLGSSFFFPSRRGLCDSSQTIAVRLLGNNEALLDASRPPLTADEVERAALTRTVFSSPFAPLAPNTAHPALLLAPDAIIYQLGPEMEPVDAVFRQKGFYTPSEVAQAFVAVTPTYFVETRHVFAAVSPAITYALEQRFTRAQLVSQFLSWYPMVFTLRKGRMQKTVVKLNTDMWFIRAHPDFKKGDRLHFRNNAEYNVAVGGVLSKHLPVPPGAVQPRPSDALPVAGAQDAQIASILIQHLPRMPARDFPELSREELDAKRWAPMKLVDWINGFAQEEIDVLNRVPQYHVVELIQRYHGVFQLMCLNGEDPLLFTPSHAYKTAPASRLDFVATISQAPTEAASAGESARASAPDPSRRRTPPSVVRAPWEDELNSIGENSTSDDIGVDDVLTESTSASTQFDMMYVRRRPASIAPRALSDFGLEDSPLPDIVRLAAGYLSVPPSLADKAPDTHPFQPAPRLSCFGARPRLVNDGGSKAGGRCFSTRHPGAAPSGPLWRWRPVDHIYQALSRAQRQALRPYKGLVNFLRLHGTLFELSEDMQHVIAHDPSGLLTPLVPTQRRFAFESRVTLPEDFDDNPASTAALAGSRERELFQRVLGKSQIPTTRRQILLLDPHNPVLFHDVLYEEIANVMPDKPITLAALLQSLPPILRAALALHMNLSSSRFFIMWEERGIQMIQRSDVGKPKALDVTPCSVEEAIEAIFTVIPEAGVTVRALTRLYLSVSEVAALTNRFGGVLHAVRAFPQFFRLVESHTGSPADTLVCPRE